MDKRQYNSTFGVPRFIERIQQKEIGAFKGGKKMKYTPVGDIEMDRIYSYIDETLNKLGIEHDETVAQIIVNSICRDGVEICSIKLKKK